MKHDASAERIDSALFGIVPEFARASLRLSRIDHSRSGPVGAFLRRMSSRSASVLARAADGIRPMESDSSERWRDAYERVGLPADVVPPSAALAAWAATPGGVPSTGAVADLVNAFSLMHDTPTAVYDLAIAEGGLWLRPARGHETFAGPDEVETPPINEIILADGADRVVARHWHGSSGWPFRSREDITTVQVHLDVLDSQPVLRATRIAEEFSRLARGYLRCDVSVLVLDRDNPIVHWPSSA